MAFQPRKYWRYYILLAAIGCEKPTDTLRPESVVVTRMVVENSIEDAQPEEVVKTAWDLKEEKVEAEIQLEAPLLPLRNFPAILETTFGDGDAVVTVKNVGNSTLLYRGGELNNKLICLQEC